MVRELYKTPDLEADIKCNMKWFGHVVRTGQTKAAKKISERTPDCRRDVEGTDSDGLKRWRMIYERRNYGTGANVAEELASVVKEAKVL
jgi:hypothetical protein